MGGERRDARGERQEVKRSGKVAMQRSGASAVIWQLFPITFLPGRSEIDMDGFLMREYLERR
jgi:hypothetical protein